MFPKKWSEYWEFARPFTLLMPGVGMAAGGVIAWGATPRFTSDWDGSPAMIFMRIAAGSLMAAVLNAGSNGLNQIYDLEIDRINKPGRPLPSDRMSLFEAWVFTWITLVAGLLLAWSINWQCLLLAAAAMILTAAYSVPPLRTKRWGIAASVTVAIPRGFLLPVAGWATVKTAAAVEPWLLCMPLGFFILGASATKDFSDIEGDRAGGCYTLPVRYGIRKTAFLIAPFFVLPFLLWPILAKEKLVTAAPMVINGLSLLLALMGAYIDFRILRRPEELSKGENHISWKLIYLMAVFAYAGLALAYLIP